MRKNCAQKGCTVWSIFETDPKYFGARKQGHMPSYRAANLKRVLAALKSVGIDPKKEESEYEKFAWIKDGAVNRIEFGELPKVR